MTWSEITTVQALEELVGLPTGRVADQVRSSLHVLDDHTIAVAERPGNRRVEGYRHVISDPQAGMVFLDATDASLAELMEHYGPAYAEKLY